MKKSQLLTVVWFLLLLLALNRFAPGGGNHLGGLPLWGWALAGLSLVLAAVVHAASDAARARQLLEAPPASGEGEEQEKLRRMEALRQELDPEGPDYPHPVIITERCIGCHACVEACPHDVLSIVGGYASVMAPDQCAEDTSCQVVCPVNPKACIVVNTLKEIKPLPAPQRDATYMTNVPGCYIVGDVSGTPLIKNAANEGAKVIEHIGEELSRAPAEPRAALDVAVIGIGPAGLSATIRAQQLGLSYVGIEQDKVLSTIENYPKGKYVFLKPETMQWRAALDLPDPAGEQRERLLRVWRRNLAKSNVRINEDESCKAIRRAEDGGDYFLIETERGTLKERVTYTARRVVLALGNRGTPMKLKVPGADSVVTRDGRTLPRVQYKLENPEEFRRSKIIIVGAGNSAVEAAIDLVARRDGTRIQYRPEEEMNEVTLVIRSDFRNDLKFTNKQQIYDCIDDGRIKVHYYTVIKEILDGEVTLAHARTGEERGRIGNDFIFAMIGGDRPREFLESIGIKIA